MKSHSRRFCLATLLVLVPCLGWGRPSFHPQFHPRVNLAGSPGAPPAIPAQPAQLVELDLRIRGLAPDEQRVIHDRLQVRLEAEIREVRSWSDRELGPAPAPGENPGPVRVLKVTIRGRKNPYEGAGNARTCLLRSGHGALTGTQVGALALCQTDGLALNATLEILGGTAAFGGIIGFATGPRAFRANQVTKAQFGYLPWRFDVRWQVATRLPGQVDKVLAQGSEELPLKAFLNPLAPEDRTAEQVRQENLRAGLEALVANLGMKQDRLSAGTRPGLI